MNLNLTKKIIINFVAILIIPMLFTVYLVREDLNLRAKKEVENHLLFVIKIVNSFLHRSLTSSQIKLSLLCDEEEFKMALEKEDKLEIEKIIKSWVSSLNYSFLEIYSFNNNTFEVYLSVLGNGNLLLEDSLKPDTNTLTEVLNGTNHSTILFTKNKNKRAYLRNIIKVKVSHKVQKSFIISVYYPFLNDTIDSIKEITNIDIMIFDENESILSTKFDPQGKRTTNVKLKDEIINKLKENTYYKLEENFLNEQVISIYTPFYDINKQFCGYVCIMVPNELFTKANLYVISNLYVILIISLILAMLSGYLLSINIVKPLKEFVNVAHKTSEGDFKQKINIQQSDEIGELAVAFNKMSEKLDRYNESLKRKIFEITTLYEVAQSMNFLNNKDQILNIILTKMIEALNAEKGSIMLYNHEEGYLSCEMAVGYFGNFEKRIKFAPGEGKAGQAFVTGNIIISNDIQNDKDFVRTALTKNTDNVTRNIMCVPMRTKDAIIGVINIVNKKSIEGFNDDDKALALSLSTQAALTIENAKLYELSITDGMTKLFIHRYFQIRLDEELKRALRYNSKVSLLLTDIDHFKKFNDTYGHQVGDMVLIKVAEIVRETIRNEIDIPCRYGGEEFAIIAPQTEANDAKKMAERIRTQVEQAELLGPNEKKLKITISIGVATFPDDSNEKKDLILKADSALYHSKHTGRNKVTHYEDIKDTLSENNVSI